MIFVGRIICDLPGDRIGKLPLKYFPACEYVRDAVSAFHATLPCIDNGFDMAAVPHEFHIDDVCHI